MNVLHVAKFYPPHPGGLERAVEFLAEGAAGEGIDVRVLVFGNTGPRTERRDDHLVIHRVPYRLAVGTMPLSARYLDAYRRHQPWADVVHFHEPFPLGSLAFSVFPRPRRTVLSWHSDIVRQKLARKLAEPLQQRLCAASEKIIVSTDALRLSSAGLREWRAKTVVIPFGLDLAPYRDGSDNGGVSPPADLERRYGGPFALAVGRLVYYKGFDVLVRAMTRLEGRIVIVGSGPLHDDLRRQIAAHGLGDRVILTGGLSDGDLRLHYRACRFLVFPSTHPSETFGFVQVEAMAAGKPVINTRLPTGVPEVSLDGVTGVTVPPGDHDALAEAFDQLWRDGALRQRLGDAARQRAFSNYDRAALKTRIRNLYLAL